MNLGLLYSYTVEECLLTLAGPDWRLPPVPFWQMGNLGEKRCKKTVLDFSVASHALGVPMRHSSSFCTQSAACCSFTGNYSWKWLDVRWLFGATMLVSGPNGDSFISHFVQMTTSDQVRIPYVVYAFSFWYLIWKSTSWLTELIHFRCIRICTAAVKSLHPNMCIAVHCSILFHPQLPWYRESAHHWELRDQVWKE